MAVNRKALDLVRLPIPPRPQIWCQGQDSNLRSPQGAADLQSAGISRSPTLTQNKKAAKLSGGLGLKLELRSL